MKSSKIKLAIEATKARIGFDRFSIYNNPLTEEQKDTLRVLPAVGNKCRVRLHPDAKSSAYGGMWEFAAIAGYMQAADEIQALVVFLERENVDTDNFDWAFVSLKQLKEYHPERI